MRGYLSGRPHAADIAAYAWQAAVWCVDCTGTAWRGMPTMLRLPVAAVEAILDESAARLGIDRMREGSFDSWDFPKVMFVSDIDGTEHCDNCGDCIGHDYGDCDASRDDD